MIVLSESVIRKIERVRKNNRIIQVVNYLFFTMLTMVAWVAIYTGTWEDYNFCIIALLLSKGLINCVNNYFNDPVEEILDVTQYNHSKFKYNNL
jgi:hypothetical protein